MTLAAILAAALLLDALLGEPEWLWSRLPHPAVVMGRFIDRLDRKLNQGNNRRAAGIRAVAILVIFAGALGLLIGQFPASEIVQTVFAAILLAHRSLVDHIRDVTKSLVVSIEAARQSVAMIVGRDTSDLDEAAIARATIESAAENFSDGVIAPAFWLLAAGLPGLLIYKIVNTADSMIGHRNEKYEEFGWAAARLDDVLNWVPARLTAVIIAAAHFKPSAWHVIKRDAGLHRSPNAGWPESAMAAVLNVAISGPRSYDGVLQDFPFVNAEGRHDLTRIDINAVVVGLWRSWALAFLIVGLLAVA